MKDSYYFSHDSNARHDEKILALRMKHDWMGYGIYWALIERLRETENYMCVKDYNLIAFDLRVDSSIIKSIIEDFGLFAFTEDNKNFYSERLTRNMNEKENRRKIFQENGKKGGRPTLRNKKIISSNSEEKEEPPTLQNNQETTKRFQYKNQEVSKQKPSGLEETTKRFQDKNLLKERKGKERKEKENKEYNIISSSLNSEDISENKFSATDNNTTAKKEIDFQKIVSTYHDICKDYPKIIKLSEARKQKIRIRFVEEMKEDFALLENIFKKMQASKFMRGDNKNGWKASFDWIFTNSTNWVKVAEGNYDNKEFRTNGNNIQTDSDRFHAERDQAIVQDIVRAISEL